MSVSEYVSWWRRHKAGEDDRLLYLKDWHFANEFPGYKVGFWSVLFRQAAACHQ